MSDRTNAERQARFRAEQKKKGLVLVRVWVTPDIAEKIKALASANAPR